MPISLWQEIAEELRGLLPAPADDRVSVFELVRIGYDQNGEPFRVTRTTYPADRNEFLMTGGTVPPEPPALSEKADS